MQTRVFLRTTSREREETSRYLANGKSITGIYKELERHRTTIYREIKRNTGATGYRAFSASKRAEAAAGSRRKGKTRLSQDQQLRDYGIRKVRQQWSPRAISERMKIDYPLGMRISHEAIYRYI